MRREGKKHGLLIEQLVSDGKVNRDIQECLEKTRAQVDELLIDALKNHRDDLMREVCAAILGERRSRKAVPSLLRALSDRSSHVRTDALWAIEKAAGLNVGELCAALLLDVNDWSEVRRRMRAWWRAVKDDPYFAY